MFLNLGNNQNQMNKDSENSLLLSEAKIPQNQVQNLKSKMDSLIRSIENLSEKKIRLEFEIRRQKKSLARKREELKRLSRNSKAKISLSLEAQTLDENLKDPQAERKEIDRLLSESARLLEE